MTTTYWKIVEFLLLVIVVDSAIEDLGILQGLIASGILLAIIHLIAYWADKELF